MNEEIISLRIASRSAGVAHTTIKAWALKYGIGSQMADGRWNISRVGLERVLDVRRADAALRSGHDPR